jgi:hypothetical protein
MRRLLLTFCFMLFTTAILHAQNGNGSGAQTVTQDIKKEAEKLKNGGDAIKNGKKKAKAKTQAQKDALKKKKKKVNAKNAKKELDKIIK